MPPSQPPHHQSNLFTHQFSPGTEPHYEYIFYSMREVNYSSQGRGRKRLFWQRFPANLLKWLASGTGMAVKNMHLIGSAGSGKVGAPQLYSVSERRWLFLTIFTQCHLLHAFLKVFLNPVRFIILCRRLFHLAEQQRQLVTFFLHANWVEDVN